MSYFVLINDIHLSDRAPASCTETYLDDLFDLLDYCARLAEELSGTIVLAGDVFNHKTPGRTSHATVMRLIAWARQALARVYVVLGNHDLSHDRVESVHETQPLGVVIASGAIELLDGWMDDGSPVYGVPWQMRYDVDTVNDALADYRRRKTASRNTLVVTHAPLYPPGRELKYEYFPAQFWATAMANSGTVHYGHVHERHGIYHTQGVTFSNCGALSRGSLTEANLTRIPAVAVWNSATGAIKHIDLPAKPADEVFRLTQANEKKTHALDLSNFLGTVEETRIEVTSTASVLDHVRRTQDDPKLISVIARLLEDADR